MELNNVIYNRVKELNSKLNELEITKENLIKERENYYWRINLCNSSDSFKDFKDENPNHPLLQYCHVQRPINTGYKSNVIVRILQCDISREDFLSFARLIVSPYVGDEDFNHFEFRYPTLPTKE